MAELIELDDVDALGTGAVGEPGQRAFYIQARTEHAQLTVLVEKEQVALLATEAVAFLDRIADDYPEVPFDAARRSQTQLREPTVPLFRARLIGLGFDPERELVLHRAARARRRRRRRRRRRPTPATMPRTTTRRATSRGSTRPAPRCGRWPRAAPRPSPAAPAVPAVRACRWTPPGTGVPAGTDARRARRGAPATAELEVVGRMRYSSNATFLVEAKRRRAWSSPAIYKPRRGERPLWDFPDGTLCQREVAAYELSDALGWDVVPVTILRDGPLGEGAVQRFVEHDPDEHYFTLLDEHEDRFRRVRGVRRARQQHRPQGRALPARRGQRRDRRHRPRAHVPPAWKLRTVIWDFAGEPAARRRRPTTCAASSPSSTTGRSASGSRALLDRRRARRGRAPRRGRCSRDGPSRSPTTGYRSTPWPLV